MLYCEVGKHHFEMHCELGRGSFGTVHKVMCQLSGRSLAMKICVLDAIAWDLQLLCFITFCNIVNHLLFFCRLCHISTRSRAFTIIVLVIDGHWHHGRTLTQMAIWQNKAPWYRIWCSKSCQGQPGTATLQDEIDIMKYLDHEKNANIIRLYRAFECPDSFYLAMELCSGGP